MTLNFNASYGHDPYTCIKNYGQRGSGFERLSGNKQTNKRTDTTVCTSLPDRQRLFQQVLHLMLCASVWPVIYDSVAAASSVETQLKRNLFRDEDNIVSFPSHYAAETLNVDISFKLTKVIYMV